jgi:hypothetical protein
MVLKNGIMNKKQKRVLDNIFQSPVRSNIEWKEVESLLIHLGAEVSQGSGSRIRIILNGVKAVFHKPHPHKEMDKGAVISLRRFLENAGIKYEV